MTRLIGTVPGECFSTNLTISFSSSTIATPYADGSSTLVRVIETSPCLSEGNFAMSVSDISLTTSAWTTKKVSSNRWAASFRLPAVPNVTPSGSTTYVIRTPKWDPSPRSEEHTSELQSLTKLVCRLLLENKQT